MMKQLTPLLLLLLSVLPLCGHASDWVLNESMYSAQMVGDHLYLKVFLADLDKANTYSKGGHVYAKKGSKTIKLMYLEYINQGDDESQTAEVRAYVEQENALAWFNNSQMGEQKIGTSNSSYWLTKWGSDHHYMTAMIDYYYPAEMAGGSWNIYYEFTHSNGSDYTKTLNSSCWTSTDLGLAPIDASKYSYERTGPDNIKFRVPRLPDDVPSKVSDLRSRFCYYDVTYTFYRQNGSRETVKDTYECDKQQEKEYNATIPESVGNAKRIDMSIRVRQGLRDPKNFFWATETWYSKNDVFRVVPVPGSIATEYRQFDNATDLTWTQPPGEGYYACTPYVYRVETDANGNPKSGSSWSRRATLDNLGGSTSQSYTDDGVQAGSYYKYMVLNVPKDWIGKSINASLLNSPGDDLLKKLGYSTSATLSATPTVTIYHLQQDTTVSDKVNLTWEYSRVPTDATTVTFQILRKTSDDGEWSQCGTVDGDAQLTGGKVLTFSDSSLPNVGTRYQYKVRLQLLDGKYEFFSDPIRAGLLAGSQVKGFTATKGTHDSTVRLSWNARQIGIDNSTYVISRRYVNTGADFMQIHTVHGVSELYTYEDNTVQPGYYYEYKIEVYSGSVLQNTLYDVGFCQARGVISGRVTFGTGSSVENVRLSLRPSNTTDDNTVQSYSQRVDGASTGITWQADDAEADRVFGNDKDFTVQMFVRPDEGLAEGAVIGNIPGVGLLMTGQQQGDAYKLCLLKDLQWAAEQETYYEGISQLRVIYYRSDNAVPDYVFGGDTVFTDSHYKSITNAWKADGYAFKEDYDAPWAGDNALIAVYYKKGDLPIAIDGGIQGSCYDVGLTLPARTFSQLTVRKRGAQTEVMVGDQTSATMSFVKTMEYMPYSKNFPLADDIFMYNGQPVYFGGSKTAEVPGGWLWERYIGSTPVNILTREVDDVMPFSERFDFSVGGGTNASATTAFRGNLAEVRVWNHALSKEEVASYADRVLNGREQGLRLYWPMDEGLDRYVFDASYANDLPNGRHATVGTNITASTIVPAADQLSRYALTNENGEYIIRGIPFVGSGSTYTILPTKGIHEFSPQSRNGFIGNGNLTLNSYDFTDVSSFPVRGKVTFLNTNIPVDSVQFMIDGNLVQSKEGVMTDANGEFEIAVPIGPHLIECYRNGHRFTSFPLDRTTTYDFKKSEVVNFVDSTLVNVTGRINGGYSDQDAPIGFHKSENRLGRATLKLSLGKESQCSFNYIVDDRGDGYFGTENIPVESATDSIRSTAYRAGGDHDDTYYVYITTDEQTGEFSAMLPPLKYKVESIKFEGGADYDDKPVFAQNLPVMDATNTIQEKMKKDSLVVNNRTHEYKYSAKMIRQYRAEPTISVKQRGMKNGAFGQEVVAVTNIDNSVDSVDVLRYTDTGCEYVYGVPLFQQDKTYNFDIEVFESYRNLDSGKEYQEVPSDAVFTIMNDASATTTVFGEKATIGGEQVEVGEAYSTLSIQVMPDEKGHISYQWVGGWPNLADGNLRNLSIGVKVEGRTTMWHAPNSQSDALDLIILGGIGSGTNFVTSGPDDVDMVIRRPPGSTSVAEFTSNTVKTYTTTRIDINKGGGSGGGFYLSETPTFEVSTGSVGPITLLTDSKWKFVAEQTETFTGKWFDTDSSVDDSTYSVSSSMATPDQMVLDMETMTYAPEGGDTYVGRATNLLFSKGRILGLFKQDDGSFKLDEKEGITVSQSFGTVFVYPQAYILNTLIPNWQAIIRSKLEEGHIAGDHWDEANTPRVSGKVIYYTKYSPGDEQFGKGNGDTDYWSAAELSATKGFPSYRMINGTDNTDVDDEVEYAIKQIGIWQYYISQNEQDKLNAFNDASMLIKNYSIAAGSKVSETVTNIKKDVTSHSHTYSFTWNSEMKYGPMLNDAGVNVLLTGTAFDEYTDTNDTTITKTTEVAWTMSDSDPRTALSVDVYRSQRGWGPIFFTRGGQTANPYEDGSYTRFYQPGTKLNEATMRVENPQLRVIGSAELTDVPTGGQALFTLQLSNQSETNDICNYVLEVKEGSNPSGAVLVVDGNILSNGMDGRLIKMKGGETIEKTLVVTQSDRSVIDYDDIVLILRSEKDQTILSEEVKLRVHFVPSSARVDLAVDHTVVNKDLVDVDGGITAKMTGLDRQDNGLQGLRLRYRRKGTDSWTVIKQWTTIDQLVGTDYTLMPSGSQVTEKVSFLADGIYELQAQTFGMYGNEEVTYQSNIVEVVQDTHGPKMLGMVSPSDGKLNIVNRNNMHIRFNEMLNGNALSKSDNFRIEGGMNNVVFGEGKYPDVAVQLNNDRIETEAMFDLTNTDYAFDLWFYRQGDGTIISVGTDDNTFSLSTHDDGLLQARLGDDDAVYDANVRLPRDKWMYMAMNYKRRTDEDSRNRISMLYVTADDAEPVYVGRDVLAGDVDGHGKLSVGGDGMQGMISGLSIWNSDITAQQLYETRNKGRASFTPGLVGYWRMDEGHGTQITDHARARHMYMPTESWYINNENRAAHISGEKGSAIKIDISTFNPAQTDNFAYEMWFRGNEADNNKEEGAILVSVKNSSKEEREVEDSITIVTEAGNQYQQYVYKVTTTDLRTAIGFREGKISLIRLQDLEERSKQGVNIVSGPIGITTLSEKNYLDGNWHHLALNVRRGTSSIVYLDGQPVKVLPEGDVPGISSRYLVVGGEHIFDSWRDRFVGDVDEIRLWSAALDGQLISDRMYERMDNSYPGLVGYFPMESIHRTQQGNVTTEFTMDNFGESISRLKIDTLNTTAFAQSVNSPALKPGSTKMRLDDTQFDFTASADEIYFSFPDNLLPLMDSNDFVVTVSHIKDEHGNNSEPVSWKFHTNFASVEWLGQDYGPVNVEKSWDETMTITENMYSGTGLSQTYQISGLPSWMTVDKAVGTIDTYTQYVVFTIGPTVPIGRQSVYIYLTDRNGIRRVLLYNILVKGDEPEWMVDYDLYESNMALTAQAYVGDKISDYTNTKVAAFDEMGLCCGVASPMYVPTRDAYYVNMTIYGASATDLSTGKSNLTFMMYDASTGTIYPVVNLIMPDGTQATSLAYTPDAVVGSYNAPVQLRSTDDLQQINVLNRGWTWMSLYVQPESTDINDVLPKSKSERKKYQYVKSKTAFASASSDGSTISGSLTNMEPGNMYKVQVSSSTKLNVQGKGIDVTQRPQTIRSGYNWIGSLSGSNISVDDAFADLQPEVGDMVKSRTAYAVFGSRGTWEGLLESIVPGEGYVYQSMADHEKTFHYPRKSSAISYSRSLSMASENYETHFVPVDDSRFPDNMIVTAVVEKDGQRIDDAEVGAFISDECRGTATFNQGYYFLTIMGSSADDRDDTVELRVYHDGQVYTIENDKHFVSDAAYGTLDEPYVLSLDNNADGIINVTADDDDGEWYTLQGFKIGRRPAQPGIYLHKGKTAVVH